MKYLLRIAAVLVALGNWFALMTGDDLYRLASYGLGEWLTFFLVPTVLGLAAAEVALRHAANALRGGFLDRYAAVAATVWIGGMFCGVALASVGVLRDEALGIVGTVGFGAVASLWGDRLRRSIGPRRRSGAWPSLRRRSWHVRKRKRFEGLA
jgi:hypothetical protein